jgi:hypothetical protein
MNENRAATMDAFLARAGWGAARRDPLPGDASTRRYVRLHGHGRSALLMDQPQGAETAAASVEATPEQRAALGYNAVARLAGADCGRFVAVAKHLRRLGLSAPGIYAADIPNGFLLIEDFGDSLYADVVSRRAQDEPALYAAAIDALVRLHAEAAPREIAPGVPLHAYDETALLVETELMTQWFVPTALRREANADEITEHRALWRAALREIRDVAPVFVHRDYHAQNLLWLPQQEGIARAGMIDFQDAVAGSRSYDLVSLLQDARRDVPPELRQAMIARYLEQAKTHGQRVDAKAFHAEAAFFAAQRNAKIIGIFARLAKRDGKMRYLTLLPRVWRHMENGLSHPSMAALKDFYARLIPQDARGAPTLGEAAS